MSLPRSPCPNSSRALITFSTARSAAGPICPRALAAARQGYVVLLAKSLHQRIDRPGADLTQGLGRGKGSSPSLVWRRALISSSTAGSAAEPMHPGPWLRQGAGPDPRSGQGR